MVIKRYVLLCDVCAVRTACSVLTARTVHTVFTAYIQYVQYTHYSTLIPSLPSHILQSSINTQPIPLPCQYLTLITLFYPLHSQLLRLLCGWYVDDPRHRMDHGAIIRSLQVRKEKLLYSFVLYSTTLDSPFLFIIIFLISL